MPNTMVFLISSEFEPLGEDVTCFYEGVSHCSEGLKGTSAIKECFFFSILAYNFGCGLGLNWWWWW